MLPRRAVAVWLALTLIAAAASAQGPEADWRTLETEHFRVHFPAELEAWARRAASRFETIRTAVSEEVGYVPPQRIDVVVADPRAQANGSAWPLLRRPRLVLWTTPPSAASGLGHFADWGELVAVHEIAHLVHLLRPSRDPLQALAERTVLPVGPLALTSPRWAIEGYATLLEGRLTGSGRPHSALRSAILRQWGRQGRLPSYARLSRDPDGFLGMSMAYLAGSAYLEWLERRQGGARALRDLWSAASARGRRDFDAAFERIFGDGPEPLWRRFAAETATAAIERERRLAPSAREGEIWLDRSGASRSLEVSPDGTRLAAVLGRARVPDRLVVWSLVPRPPASETPPARALDPEDPPAIPRPPRERESLAELEPPPGTRLSGARFLPRGEGLLVGLLAPDLRGRLHGELAVWRPGSAPRRITRGADLHEADPSPDGRFAIAVRRRHGESALVRVDLDGARIEELAAPSLERIQDRPRISPDGRRLAWLEHREGRWRLLVAALDSSSELGEPQEILPEDGGEAVDLAWRGDASLLYVVVARDDELDIEAVPVAAGALGHRVTRSIGAALAPAPTPDGTTLYYLGLDADGLDIRRLGLDAATLQEAPPTQEDAVPERVERTESEPPFPTGGTLPPSRPYGLGRAESTLLLGGLAASETGVLEGGLRLGDLLGRWELVALAAGVGDGATEGAALRLVARPAPASLSLHVGRLRDELGELDAVELAAERALVLGRSRLGLSGGAGWSTQRDPTRESWTGFLGVDVSSVLASGRARLEPGFAVDASRSSGDSDLRLLGARLRLSARAGDWSAGLELERREADGVTSERDRIRLGGAPSSIAPRSARPSRLEHPAFAPGTLVGERYDAERLRLAGRAPVALSLERHRVDEGPWLRLAALELGWELPALPLVALPAVRFDLGVGVVDGAGFDRDARWWVGLTFPVAPGTAGLAASPAFSSSPTRR